MHTTPLRRLACQPIPGSRTAAFIGLLKSAEPSIGSALLGLTFLRLTFHVFGCRSLAAPLFTLIIAPAEDVLHYHVR